MKKLTLSVAALTIAMMSYGQTQCKGLTTDSVNCKNTTKNKVELCKIYGTYNRANQKIKIYITKYYYYILQ